MNLIETFEGVMGPSSHVWFNLQIQVFLFVGQKNKNKQLFSNSKKVISYIVFI